MDSSGLTVPIDLIREAARARVAVSSLRSVASETGVSYTALRNLLAGGVPYSANLAKLTKWYLTVSLVDETDVNARLAALTMVVGDLPVGVQQRAMRAVVREITKLCAESRTEPPSWLRVAETYLGPSE